MGGGKDSSVSFDCIAPACRPTEELQLQEDGHWGESLDLPAPNAVRGAGLVNLRQGGDRREGRGCWFFPANCMLAYVI